MIEARDGPTGRRISRLAILIDRAHCDEAIVRAERGGRVGSLHRRERRAYQMSGKVQVNTHEGGRRPRTWSASRCSSKDYGCGSETGGGRAFVAGTGFRNSLHLAKWRAGTTSAARTLPDALSLAEVRRLSVQAARGPWQRCRPRYESGRARSVAGGRARRREGAKVRTQVWSIDRCEADAENPGWSAVRCRSCTVGGVAGLLRVVVRYLPTGTPQVKTSFAKQPRLASCFYW